MAAAERQQIWTAPAAASTAVAALITGPAQPAEIIADFPVATYLRVDTAVIALVTPAAVRLPNALVCRDHVRRFSMITGTFHTHGVKSAGDHGGDGPVVVGDGGIQLGRARVTVGRWWDPVPRLPAVTDPSALGRAVDAMRSLLPAWPDPDEPAAGQLQAGREALASALAGGWTVDEAADRLVGLGPGLTPAGDDLLAGAVAGMVIFGRALGRRSALVLAEQVTVAAGDRAARTTVLAADLLRHAGTGAVAEPVATVCGALTGQRPLESALERALTVGHTSGRDLAEGLLLGVTAALAAR